MTLSTVNESGCNLPKKASRLLTFASHQPKPAPPYSYQRIDQRQTPLVVLQARLIPIFSHSHLESAPALGNSSRVRENPRMAEAAATLGMGGEGAVVLPAFVLEALASLEATPEP